MKKAVITILIVLIIASLAVIGYFIYNQNKAGASNLIQSISGNVKAPISLFPIGTTTPNPSPAIAGDQATTSTPVQSLGVPNRPELSQMNIASIAVITVNKNLKTIFSDKSSGNIYTLDDQNNPNRLSNATLPAMGESYFGSDASGWRAILRQEKGGQVSTNIGLLKITGSSTGPFELKISPWINPSSLAVAPNGSKIAYLETQLDGSATLYTNDWNLKSTKKVWSSPLKEWVVNWPKDNLISLTSRASFDYPGTASVLDLKTSQSKVILNNINGLTTNTSPDGQKIIYSKSLLDSFSLYQYDQATGTSRLLDLNTLPDKCVWFDNDILYCAVPKTIEPGRYPDDWYQGKISFSDNIWRIDLKQRTTLLAYPLKGNYDLVNLTINKQTGWLYALNKSDNTLQAFSLKP